MESGRERPATITQTSNHANRLPSCTRHVHCCKFGHPTRPLVTSRATVFLTDAGSPSLFDAPVLSTGGTKMSPGIDKTSRPHWSVCRIAFVTHDDLSCARMRHVASTL